MEGGQGGLAVIMFGGFFECSDRNQWIASILCGIQPTLTIFPLESSSPVTAICEDGGNPIAAPTICNAINTLAELSRYVIAGLKN